MRLRILNMVFDPVTLPQTVEWARDWLKSNKSGWITTVNVAIMMMARRDYELQAFINRSALTVADGMPLVWVSRLVGGLPLPERVTGVELVDELVGMAAAEKVPVYFMGGTGRVIGKVIRRMRTQYPDLEIAGFDDGYFGPDEELARAQAVRKSGARMLIVGMGVPRQERFLARNWKKLGVELAIPVGGSFDVIAGEKMRAPQVVQAVGLEWLFRLAQEPGRLWRRYATTNSEFLLLMLKDLVLKRSPSAV